MGQSELDPGAKGRPAWNAGRKLGAKRALEPQQVWADRFWLDSKERGCDIVETEVGDIVPGGRVRSRAIVIQQSAVRRPQGRAGRARER